MTKMAALSLPRGYIHVQTIIFKHLVLLNHLANQSQILCGASFGRGKKLSWSHDQDGRHANIWPKPLKNLFPKSYDFETLHAALETQALPILYK